MNIPSEVLKLLEKEKFCSLATCCQDTPHVSLMNFTYLSEEGLIILSSRENTTKVQHIKSNPAVAVLLFTLGSHEEMPLGCTLYGKASVVNREKEKLYRKKHFDKNPDMGKFIMEDNIVVIIVTIQQVILSDVEDNVHTWSSEDSP